MDRAKILDEVDRALIERGISPEKNAERRRRMNNAVRDCLVTDYEPLIEGLKLPDPDDRHVLAAAIKAGAQVIVTNNLKDFPPDYLADWDIERKSPDDFVMDLIDMDGRVVYSCAREIADSRRNPPVTFDEVLLQSERSGLIESSTALRADPLPHA
ncbi:PIN domain-containing protein [Kitasatospora sp. NPDC004615]|uniref:PIN domain-containing protein n=1 Tax=Kitasatospora sp. NPDC004615 TaxID=3364017 RepID=UPI0036AC5CEF